MSVVLWVVLKDVLKVGKWAELMVELLVAWWDRRMVDLKVDLKVVLKVGLRVAELVDLLVLSMVEW